MKISFSKYQGAGNDFIIIDNRLVDFDCSNTQLINTLCNRRIGIGADGLILLNNHDKYDFEMLYFNADGNLSSMCGNGSRCVVDFAKQLNIFESECHFLAFDGPHHAKWFEDKVCIQMSNVNQIEIGEDYFFLDTGSPHYVKFVKNIDEIDLLTMGQAIRYNNRFTKEGTNVNFVELNNFGISIRTYERGVEAETLACGTGAVACALSTYTKGLIQLNSIPVKVKGGMLLVNFEKERHFKNIYLSGPYQCVFKGEIVC
ncbi:MAG: diaminopimelate epimerase [Flavobacteriales bacterium]